LNNYKSNICICFFTLPYFILTFLYRYSTCNYKISDFYQTLKKTFLSDSMLRTSHSDTKITISNPNLKVKMFNKGVQTYLESDFSMFPDFSVTDSRPLLTFNFPSGRFKLIVPKQLTYACTTRIAPAYLLIISFTP